MSLKVEIQTDGDAHPYNDPVLLVGAGVHGQATYRIEVILTALSDKGGLVIATATWRRSEG